MSTGGHTAGGGQDAGGVVEAAGRWLLALTIAGSALAVGAVHTRTLVVVACALVAAAVALWIGSGPSRARPAASVLLWTGVALTAWTVLQSVPLPTSWLAALAPRNADVWSRALAPLGEAGPARAPISLDPIGTHVEILKGVAYVAAFLAALPVARRQRGVTFLSAVVIAVGLALATAAVVHPAFGVRKLYGWYEPGPGIDGRHVAPLMNPNNLAAYLDLSFCVALGMVLSPTPRLPRAVTAAAVVLLVAAQVWVASRSGVVGMGVGAIVVMVIARTERRENVRGAAWVAGLSAAALLVGAVLVVLYSSEEVPQELLSADTSKVKALLRVTHMYPDHAWLGVGRGAFESTYPAFRTDFGHVTYTNPENLVLQWTTEWGIPVGIAGLVAVGAALRPTAVLARSRAASGAWAGLLAVAVHDLADFSTEVPGVMLGCIVCAAIVTAGVPGHESRSRFERWPRHPVVLATALPLALAGALALVVPELGRGLVEERLAVQQACVGSQHDAAEVHAIARSAMLDHPGEPYIPFVVGLRAWRARDDRPLPWLAAALERATVYGPAHLVLARLLAPVSPAQARLEYRLALTQEPRLQSVVEHEGPRLVGGYDDALEIAPDGDLRIPVLQALADAIADRLPATSERLERDVARRSPRAVAPAVAEALDAVLDLEMGEAAPWCAAEHRAECAQRALDLSRALQVLAPQKCAGHAFEARVFVATGEPREGLRHLKLAATTSEDREACLRALVEQAMAAGEGTDADEALEQLGRVTCTSDLHCIETLKWVARKQEERGHAGYAAMTLRRARQAAPWDDALLWEAARLASRAGLHAESLSDYELLRKREPDNVLWPQKVAEETRAIALDATGL